MDSSDVSGVNTKNCSFCVMVPPLSEQYGRYRDNHLYNFELERNIEFIQLNASL